MRFEKMKKRLGNLNVFPRKTKEEKGSITDMQYDLPDIYLNVEMKIIGQGVFCKSKEIEEEVENWVATHGMNKNDFGQIVELVTGKKRPIILNNYDQRGNTFECKTFEVDEAVEVKLLDENLWIIERGKRKMCYYISKKDNLLSADYQGGVLHGKNGTVLSLNYSDKFFIGKVVFNKNQKMLITIFNPDRKSEEIIGMSKHDDIENYLLGLDFSVNAQEIVSMLIKMLDFSDEDILQCLQIKVALIDNDKVRSIVDIQHGKVEEYGKHVEDETFHVSSNGDWHYVSPEICIDYCSEDDTYFLATKGAKKDIFKSRERLLKRVEAINSSLAGNLD